MTPSAAKRSMLGVEIILFPMQLNASNRNWSEIIKIRLGASAEAFSTKFRALALSAVIPESSKGSDMWLFLNIIK